MSLAKLKLRHRNDWVIDVLYPWHEEDEGIKKAAWVFPTEAEARAKIKRLVDIQIGTFDEPASSA